VLEKGSSRERDPPSKKNLYIATRPRMEKEYTPSTFSWIMYGPAALAMVVFGIYLLSIYKQAVSYFVLLLPLAMTVGGILIGVSLSRRRVAIGDSSILCVSLFSIYLLLLTLPAHAFSQETDSLLVHFNSNQSALSPKADSLIDAYFLANKTHSRIQKITLAGYCDSTGTRAYNKRLSRDRAQAVKTFLDQRWPDSGGAAPGGGAGRCAGRRAGARRGRRAGAGRRQARGEAKWGPPARENTKKRDPVQ
jgi:hypothetical protein